MKSIVFTVLILLFCQNIVKGQSVFGKWQSIDSKTGKAEAIIEIYKDKNKAYAKVVDILNPDDKDKICIYCKGENKDKPILGMVIVNGLKEKGAVWSGGKILDPKNGNYYKCYITLVNNSKLKLRGFIGISLFGRTEYWYRVEN